MVKFDDAGVYNFFCKEVVVISLHGMKANMRKRENANMIIAFMKT